MNTANMPGFNAEASMYMASNTYRAAHAVFADVASARIIPQQCRLLCQVVCPPPQQCCHRLEMLRELREWAVR